MNNPWEDTKLRIAGIVNDSITDGPGLRLSVFAQGCPHHCSGCHNPQTHDPAGGKETTVQKILTLFDRNPLLSGLTLTGGEPFMQPDAFALLAEAIQKKHKTVFCYTGYTWEQLISESRFLPLIRQCDAVIDGPFIEGKRTLDLAFRGSANQRMIDVKKTLADRLGRVIEIVTDTNPLSIK